MKNIFFALIMATSTALFAVPSDSSLVIAQDSSLKENVEAAKIRRSKPSAGKDADRGRDCNRPCPTGPTGRTGAAGAAGLAGATGPRGERGERGEGVCPEFGFFETTASGVFVASGTAIPFNSTGIQSDHVNLVADITFTPSGTTPNTAVAISRPGFYQVNYGAGTSDSPVTTIALAINGIIDSSTVIGISTGNSVSGVSDSIVSGSAIIEITEGEIFGGQDHAALLEVFHQAV